MFHLKMFSRKSPLPPRLDGPRQHEGPRERRLLVPARGQRDEAARTAAAKTAPALHGSLSRRNSELHRAGSLAQAGVHPGLRLVVRRGHPVRNDHRPTAILRRQHSQYSSEGNET